MGKLRQFLTELSARDMSVFFFVFFFSFPDDNFSKFQWIFTKLVMGIDIVEICFANGLISFIFGRVICLQYIHILH